MTSSSGSPLFYEAIEKLAVARTIKALLESLNRYPFLLDISTDLQLTRIIRACPQRNDIVKISILFVVRHFLTRLRMGNSPEAVLKEIGGLPLYEYDPIAQLARNPRPSPDQIALCCRALALVRPDTEPDLWAYLHFLLADRLLLASQTQAPAKPHPQDFYMLPTDTLTLEPIPPNIQEAIKAYQVAGDVWEKCGQLEESAEARYELARLLIDFTSSKQRADTLQHAIELLKTTLTIWTRDSHPQQWGQVQAALGLALENDPAGLDATTLEQAIAYFEAALKIPPDSSFEQARREYHLAILYTQRYGDERANYVEHATELLQNALKIRTADKYPKEWADTQNSLANAFQKRLRGDLAQNIEQAILAYQDALKVWTYNQNPDRWAMIQRNLAEAFRQRILGQPEENQQMAINHLQNALKVYTEQKYPGEWASIHNSLAHLYCHRLAGKRAENIEKGIFHHQHALRIYNQAGYPRQWAQTLNNLANAYCDRLKDNHTTNLQKAIELYEQALQVRTYQDYPHEWAATHNNLGTAYADLRHWDQAIEHFNQALKVRTISTLPDKTLQTARNLGNVYFNLSRWDEAITAFQNAQDASNTLYRQAITAAGKRAEIGREGAITHHLAYALAKKGDLNQVAVKLEQGRARLLAEVLARDRAILDHVNKQDRSEYVTTVETIQALHSELQAAELNAQGSSAGSTTARSFVAITDKLSKANADLSNVVACIQKYEPGFLSEKLDFETLAKGIPGDNALVYLVTTSQGSMALIVPSPTGLADITNLDERHLVWLNDFHIDNLHSILFGGFLAGSVSGHSQLKDTNILPELLISLGKHLMAPLAQRLHNLGLKRIILVPTGLLGLLPLHAATLGEGSAFQDKFEIAYTPSARALAASRSVRENILNKPKSCLAIGNPLPTDYGSLNWARIEAEEVVTAFTPGQNQLLLETAAELTVVQNSLPKHSYLHFACHGLFNPDQPLTSGLIMAHNQLLTLDFLLAKTRLKATRLVVLSACQTAITDFQNVPDEAIGLPAGFLRTGVPGVIGSLWSVDDPTTWLLMARFYYYHLKKDMEPAAALSLAQQWLRELPLDETLSQLEKMREALAQKKDPRQFEIEEYEYELEEQKLDRPFVHPYHWAAFTMNGL